MPKLNANKNNNYIENPKESIIETPDPICELLFDTLKNKIDKKTKIIDIGCKTGNLSRRFYENEWEVFGIDIDDYSKEFKGKFIQRDFFKINEDDDIYQDNNTDFLILCNPPWNNPKKTNRLNDDEMEKAISDYFICYNKWDQDLFDKNFGLKYKWNNLDYYPEMFMKKIFEVFGDKVKVVLLTIYGFLMNNGINSKRYQWLRDSKFNITSILEIPKDAFMDQGVNIWNHILFFNINDLKPVWFMPEEYLEKLRVKIK